MPGGARAALTGPGIALTRPALPSRTALARWRALIESLLPRYHKESGVRQSEQLTIDRGAGGGDSSAARAGERAARSSLRTQVARLERELSGIVAEGFPHISPTTRPGPGVPAFGGGSSATGEPFAGPCLLGLEELELLRDRLAGRVQDVRLRAQERVEHERRAHELLERMKLEPGRYKFVRLPVNDLGQGGCGVWEVRPRLGLIGMLAGWWQVKLSSGCPLARGSRSTRAPDQRR